jgi:peptidoglycan/LPS O-acetylase OafA/YrhL
MTFAVTLAASSAMYQLVERPLRGRIRRLLSTRPEARAPNGAVWLAS